MKKVNPEERAKKVSLAISLVREKATEFEYQQLKLMLQQAGCPYPTLIPKLLKDSGIIEKQGKFYKFVDEKPVYYKTLLEGVNNIAHTMVESVKNSPSYQQSRVLKPMVTDEEAMIAFLKNKGYRIYKSQFIEI